MTAPDGCQTASFLYPRRYDLAERKGHFHQGVDLGRAGQAVVAVTAGSVVFTRNQPEEPGIGGYGRVLIIRGDNGFFYLYGHLESIVPELLRPGALVRERMQIGTVGNTLWERWPQNEQQRRALRGRARRSLHDDAFEFRDDAEMREWVTHAHDRRPMGAHLHFQVNAASQARGAGDRERSPFDESTRAHAVDPLDHLEQLGPWGSGTQVTPSARGDFSDADRRFFLPNGRPIDPNAIEPAFLRIEQSSQGGNFPLSSGNLWHGGVHHPIGALGTPVHAPLAGKVIAFRLDEDEHRSYREHGSTNFILLRHEVPREIAQLLKPPPLAPTTASPAPQPEQPPPAPSRPRRVGLTLGRARGRTNPPDMVQTIKQRLQAITRADGQPYYAPADPAEATNGVVTDTLHQAIVDYQRDQFERNWRGVVDEGGQTWRRLMGIPDPEPESDDEPAPGPAAEPPIVIYTLLMHLAAGSLERESERFTWLRRARLAAGSQADRDEDAHADAEEQEDRQEGASRDALAAPIGSQTPPPPRRARRGQPPPTPEDRSGWNQSADVTWVQQRLRRLGYLSSEGVLSGTYDTALDAAIRRFQERHVGYYRTHAADGRVDPGGSTFRMLTKTAVELGLRSVQPRLARVARELDASGATGIVMNLEPGTDDVIPGQALWGAGPTNSAGTGQVHWEIFSEAELMGGGDWWSVEDRDDGLTFDSAAVLGGASPHARFQVAGATSALLDDREIRALYRSPQGRSFRTLQALFRSEWSQQASAYTRLMSRGVAGADALEAQLAPFLWWSGAAGVLPTSHHVWHYHPIQFLLAYGAHTGAFTAVVIITAYDENGMPEQGLAIVESPDELYEPFIAMLGPTGAVISGVPSGPARVRLELLDDEVLTPRELTVVVGGVHRADFLTVTNTSATMSRAAR